VLAVLVLAVGAPLAVAKPAAPTTTSTTAAPAPPEPLDPRVFVLGDSVMLGAQASLAFRLGGAGWQVTQFSAESLHAYNSAGVVDAARAAGQVGELVVVGLGSNDGSSRAEFAGWIDALMEHLRGVRRVYWVNLRRFRDWVPAANADLANAAQRWPNLRVIDWDTRATPDPSLVIGDGLHLTAPGQAALAELIGSTLDAYRTERTTPLTTTTVPSTTTSASPRAGRAPARSRRARSGGSGIALGAWVAAGAAGLIAVGATATIFARRRVRRLPGLRE
jgi:lysophospholipase L1-like esterase